MSRPSLLTALWTALGALTLLIATPELAAAQSIDQPTPPEFYTLDERGVDLVSGELNYVVTEVVIGDPRAGGLQQTRGTFRTGWRDAVRGSLDIDGSTYTVTIGLESAVFTFNGTTYVPRTEDGSTLTRAGSIFTYTTRSGAVARYSLDYEATGSGQPSTDTAALIDVTAPDGEVTTYHYRSQTYCRLIDPDQACIQYGTVHRLQSITNNRGYQLFYTYASNDVNGPPGQSLNTRVGLWLRTTTATGLNNAVDYCSPTATACSFSRVWPSAAYAVDGSGNEFVTDEIGRVTTYTYTPTGFSVRLPGSTTDDLTYTSNALGTSFSVTDASGAWNYEISDAGSSRTTTVTEPLGQGMTVVSDLNVGRATGITNALGQTWSFQYDAQRRLTRTTNPEGDYVTQTYDGRGNVTQVTATPKPGSGLAAIVSSASYPTTCSNVVTCNKPTYTTDPRGNVTDYTWDPVHGGLLSVTAPVSQTGARPQTRITYGQRYAFYKDGAGSVAQAATPLYLPIASSACAINTAPACIGTAEETVSEVTYGAVGVANNLLPTAVETRAGNNAISSRTETAYSANGDVIQTDGPLAGSVDLTQYRYDDARRLRGVIGPDPDGTGALLHRALRITPDPRDNITLVEQGTTTGYSDSGWATFTTLQRQQSWYDDRNRLLRSASQDASGVAASLQQLSYDAAGRPECSATRMNPSTWSSLPASACDLAATGSLGADRVTRIAYDALSRVTSTTSGFNVSPITESVAYTANGLPQTLTDGRGNVSTMVYDGFDRLSEMRYPNPTGGGSSATDKETFSYDANGNVVTRIDRAGRSFSYTYSNLNQVARIQPSAGAAETFYDHDNIGQLRCARFVATSCAVTFTHDALGRQLTQTDAVGTTVSTYDAAGRRTALVWPNGANAAYDWDVYGSMTAVRFFGYPYAAYAHDNLGRRTAITRANGVSTSYGYDGVSRLTALSHDLAGTADDVAYTYAYNPAGQIVAKTTSNPAYVWTPVTGTTAYANDGLNRVTAVGGLTVGYDGNQNITGVGAATNGFDAYNRLTSSAGGTYVYDPLGRMASESATTTDWVSDGARLIGEFQLGSAWRYSIPGEYLDETVAQYGGGQPYFSLTDERGSVVAVAGNSGSPYEIIRYDEYGVASTASGAPIWSRFAYTGQIQLYGTPLQHYKARAYDPSLGRFVQTDPVGYAAGPNLYAYVTGDPVNLVDPLGLCRRISESWEVEDLNIDSRTTRVGCARGTAGSVPYLGERGRSGVDQEQPDEPIELLQCRPPTTWRGHVADALNDVSDATGVLSLGAAGAAVFSSGTVVGGLTFGTIAAGLGTVSGVTGVLSGGLNLTEGRYGNALATFAPMGYARFADRALNGALQAANLSRRREAFGRFAVSTGNELADLIINGC